MVYIVQAASIIFDCFDFGRCPNKNRQQRTFAHGINKNNNNNKKNIHSQRTKRDGDKKKERAKIN